MNTENRDQPEGQDPLDVLLREQVGYIEDRGFTDRVLQSLPRRRRRLLRPIVLLSTSAIGMVLACYWLPWNALAAMDSPDLLSQNIPNLSSWLIIWTVLASLAWAVINALHADADFF